MGEDITRRQFLKEAVSTTATLGAGFCIGPGIDLKETVIVFQIINFKINYAGKSPF